MIVISHDGGRSDVMRAQQSWMISISPLVVFGYIKGERMDRMHGDGLFKKERGKQKGEGKGKGFEKAYSPVRLGANPSLLFPPLGIPPLGIPPLGIPPLGILECRCSGFVNLFPCLPRRM